MADKHDEVTRQLRGVLKPRLPYCRDIAALEPTTKLRELGLDSMQAVELVLDIEDAFSIIFDEEMLNAETFATLDSLRKAVLNIAATNSDAA